MKERELLRIIFVLLCLVAAAVAVSGDDVANTTNDGCSDPILKIHNIASEENSVNPVTYNRGHDILVWVTIKLSCKPETYAEIDQNNMEYSFTLYNLTDDGYNEAQLAMVDLPRLRNLDNEKSFIAIQSYSLYYGKYRLRAGAKFLVHVTNSVENKTVDNNYDKIVDGYFNVAPIRNLTAIIQGGSFKILNLNKVQDPMIRMVGSMSLDYDFPSNELSHQWACHIKGRTKLQDNNCGFTKTTIWNEPILEVAAEHSLEVGIEYVFTLTVSSPVLNEKSEIRTGTTTQVIKFVKPENRDKMYNYEIFCFRNCATKPVPQSDIDLKCVCQDCPHDGTKNWTIEVTQGIEHVPYLPEALQTSKIGEFVHIVLNWTSLVKFLATNPQDPSVFVECRRSDDKFGGSTYSFQLHKPPFPAAVSSSQHQTPKCSITPSEGISMKTQFRLKCDRFQPDDDTPNVLFALVFIKSIQSFSKIPYPGRFGYIYYHEMLGIEEDPETTFILPTGDPEKGYKHEINVLIQDLRWSINVLSVESPTVKPLQDVKHFETYFTTDDNLHPWNIFNLVYGGNRQDVYRLALCAVNELKLDPKESGIDMPVAEQARLKWFMLQAINTTSMISLRDIEHMNSVVHAIIHHEIEDIYLENQTIAFAPFLVNVIGHQLLNVVRREGYVVNHVLFRPKSIQDYLAPYPKGLIMNVISIALETIANLMTDLRKATELIPPEAIPKHDVSHGSDLDLGFDEVDRDYFEPEEIDFDFLPHFGEEANTKFELDSEKTTTAVKNVLEALDHYADTIANELDLLTHTFNYDGHTDIMSFSVGIYRNESLLENNRMLPEVNLTISPESIFKENYFVFSPQTVFMTNNETMFASKIIQLSCVVFLFNPYLKFNDQYQVVTPLFHISIKDYSNLLEVQAKPLDGNHEIVLSYLDKSNLSSRISKLKQQTPKANVFDLSLNSTYPANPEDFVVHHLLLPEQSLFFVVLDQTNNLDINAVIKQDYRPVCSDFLSKKGPKVVSKASGKLIYQLHTAELDTHEPSGHSDLHFHLHPMDYYVALMPTQKSVAALAPEERNNITVQLSFARVRCLTMKDGFTSDGWREGCLVRKAENDLQIPVQKLHCECRHFSIFAGSIQPVEQIPEVLDKIDLFPGKHHHTIIPWIVCGCIVSYLILFILSMWLDYQRIVKRPRLIVMADVKNFYKEQFFAISIETGNNMLAATSANVCCQLYGERGRSKLYVLKDSKLDSAKTGDITTFLISSRKDLGRLEKIRVWHDNTGFYPSWYCRKITIRDVKTEGLWFFFIDGWLSILGHDTKPTLICTCPAATQDEIDKFARNKLSLRAYWHRLNEQHAWTSLFTCPPYTTFPRIERITCAMTLLCLMMIVLIAEYGFVKNESESTYEFREINFPNAFWKGAVASLAATFVGILVGLLFRRIHRNRVPALILEGDEADYKQPPEFDKDDFFTTPITHKPRHISWGQDQQQGEEALNIENDDAAPKESESVFRIPSTDMLKTENWISDALPRYEQTHDASYLIRKCDEAGGDSVEPLGMDPRGYRPIAVNSSESQESFVSGPLDARVVQPNTTWTEATTFNRSTKRSSKREHKLSELNKEFKLCEIPMSTDKMLYLPHFLLPFVWLLAMLVIISCCTFTILYGYHYGLTRSLDWTISLAIGILCSLCIWEPIFVLLKYLCEMHLIRKGLRMSREELIRKTRFVLIGTKEVKRRFKKIWPLNYQLYLNWMKNAFPPLTGSKIFNWNVDARRKLKARKGVMDVVIFFLYLLLLIFVMSVTRTQKNWQNTRIFEELLLLSNEKHVLENPHAFLKIKSTQELYQYLDQVFVPGIYLEQDFSGNPILIPHNKPDIWLSNRNAFLLGVPRIRQLRAASGPDNCDREKMLSNLSFFCDQDHHKAVFSSYVETSDFSERWNKVVPGMKRTFSPTNDFWKYHGKDTNGGTDEGYVAELGRTASRSRSVIEYLKLNSWIDSHTREIFIEFTAYNPNVNLYTLAKLKIRLTPTLTFFASVELASTRFIGGVGNADITFSDANFILLGCAYIFCCAYLLYNAATGIIDHFHYHGFQGLFQHKKILLDTSISTIGLATMINFICLYMAVKHKLKEVREDKINVFVNFIEIQKANEAQIMLYCVSMILCLFKLWGLLLVSSRRFFIIGFTLEHTRNLLFGSTLMYFMLVVAFSICTTINFGPINEHYSTVGKSILVLIYQTATGIAVRYYDWDKAEPVLGPILYGTFNIIVKFLVLNILISTLTMGLQEAKEVSIQRPFRLSYTGFILLKLQSFLPLWIRKVFAKKEAVVTISQTKERELEEAFMQVLRNHITSIEVQRMREMKDIAEDLVGPGQILISKKDKMTAKKNKMRKIGENRLNCMRELTIRHIKKCAKLEFSAEDKSKYNEFNNALLDIRCRKLQDKMQQLEEKYEAHFPRKMEPVSQEEGDVVHQ